LLLWLRPADSTPGLSATLSSEGCRMFVHARLTE